MNRPSRARCAMACLALLSAAYGGVEQATSAPGQTEFGITNFKASGDLTRLVFERKAAGSEW